MKAAVIPTNLAIAILEKELIVQETTHNDLFHFKIAEATRNIIKDLKNETKKS
jgi:hypothetical protein